MGGQGKAEEPESLVIAALRYGVTGDPSSARLLANRLLRKPPGWVGDQAAFREQVGSLLIIEPVRAVRHVQPAVEFHEAEDVGLVRLPRSDAALEPILNEPESDAIERFLREHVRADELATRGIDPSRSMLLTGPPGVGKTMTAHYIAGRLDLPLATIDLATLISSYLGKTGQNLRRALDAWRSSASVLLVDEFEALAKTRDDASDIGELKRIVSVLLLELEKQSVDTILIAATNHPELLDHGIERRFDVVVSFDLPSVDTRQQMIERFLGAQVSDDRIVAAAAAATPEFSGSDLQRTCRGALRRSVLEGEPVPVALVRELIVDLERRQSYGSANNAAKSALACLAADVAGMSYREIGRVLGVSHPTAARLARAWAPSEGAGEGRHDDRGPWETNPLRRRTAASGRGKG